MKKLANQRLGLLIDGENLEITARDLYHAKVDFRRLMSAVNDREVIRALYFRPEGKLEERFAHVLENCGLEIKRTPKNSDTWLVVAAISLATRCDTVCLVAGDLDYLPLCTFLQATGVRVEVWSWEENTARALREAADIFVPLTTAMLLQPTLSLHLNHHQAERQAA